MASLNPISGVLSVNNAAHLLRRATFGPAKSDIMAFAGLSVTQALDILFTPQLMPEPPVDPQTGSNWLPKPDLELNSDDETLFSYFKGWFIELMRDNITSIREKIVFFLHSHMPADRNIIANTTSLYYQNALYRHYAFGNFKELFNKVCVDNAMLKYIDNTLNDKDSPNENFAREMFELYTIGKGDQIGPEDYTNYTETDIKEAARVLTGFSCNFEFDTIDADTGLPRGKAADAPNLLATRHDSGSKTFTSKFGNTSIQPNPLYMIDDDATEEGALDEIRQMIDMIFAQDETARFICRKLYRYFVYYKITPEIEQDIIVPLANTFRNSNYNLEIVVRQLLSSEHFFDIGNSSSTTDIIGALIKSPIELVVGILRFFKIQLPSDPYNLYKLTYHKGILDNIEKMGMDFYLPIDVAGYPPYHQEPVYNRNWISPNWIANRYLFGKTVVDGHFDEEENILYKLDIVAFVDDSQNISDPSSARTIVTELTDYMFPCPIPTERFDYLLETLFLDGQMESHWADEWTLYKNSGDDTTVRSLLERLIIGMLQSPEYQLF